MDIKVIEKEQPDIILKDYIGDGVYCLFDGFGIWLHANHHLNPTDRIYLEPNVLNSLNNFADRCYNLKKE